MAEYELHTLSLFEFDKSVPEKFHGVLTTNQLRQSEIARKVCRKLIDRLWDRGVNYTNTYDLSFQHFVIGPDDLWNPNVALAALADGRDVEEASRHIAFRFATKGYSFRYALVLIGFRYEETNFAVVALTKSAKDTTFVVRESVEVSAGQESEIIRELNNIFDREPDKGAIYPYFDYDSETALFNKVKVYQHRDFADFFPKCLGLEVKPSATRLAESTVPAALVRVGDWHGAAEFATHLIAMAQDPNLPDVNPELARMTVRVGGVDLMTRLQDVASKAVTFKKVDGKFFVTVTGSDFRAKIGDEYIPMEALLDQEGG